MEFMTGLGETKHVSIEYDINCSLIDLAYNIYWHFIVHKNKQSYSKDSSAQEKEDSYQEIEGIIKDQLRTEYEFYNYIKQRLASQAKAISLRWYEGTIKHY